MKKLLALVLALVMTLGLATVGASAATKSVKDFSDNDKIDYPEAVEVLMNLGVVGGKDEGNYDPDAELKRSEGATIIARMLLGETISKQLEAQTASEIFTSDMTNHWAAGYVDYLTKAGIIAGKGKDASGKDMFDPDGTLTTTEFGKMLLTALGYDAEIEGLVGSDWAINTAKLASQTGLYKGNPEAMGSAAVTREETALYAFNALKTPMVEYNSLNQRQYVTSTQARDTQTISTATINDGSWAGTYMVEFGERYFPQLVRNSHDKDIWGRPQTTWTLNLAKIGSYVNNDLLVASWTNEGTTGAKVFEALGGSNQLGANNILGVYANNTRIRNEALMIYIDGQRITNDATLNPSAAVVAAFNEINDELKVGGDDLNTVSGAGRIFEAYIDFDSYSIQNNMNAGGGTQIPARVPVITLVTINTWLAQANANGASGKVPMTIYTDTFNNGELHTADASKDDVALKADDVNAVKSGEFYLVKMTREDAEKPDAGATIVEMEKATVVSNAAATQYKTSDTKVSPFLYAGNNANSGKVRRMTSITSGSAYTVAKTAWYDPNVLTNYSGTLDGTTYNLYTDGENGRVYGVTTAREGNNLVFVSAIDNATALLGGNAYTANLIFADGTYLNTTRVTMAANGSARAYLMNNNGIIGDSALNTWFTYTRDGSGNITLVDLIPGVDQGTLTVYGSSGTLYAQGSVNLAQQVNNNTNTTYANISSTSDRLNLGFGVMGNNRNVIPNLMVRGGDKSIYIAVSATNYNGAPIIDRVLHRTVGIKNTSIVASQTAFGAARFGDANSNVFFVYDNSGYVVAAVAVTNRTVASNLAFITDNVTSRGTLDSIRNVHVDTYKAILNGGSSESDLQVASELTTTVLNKLGKGALYLVNYDSTGTYVIDAALAETTPNSVNSAENGLRGWAVLKLDGENVIRITRGGTNVLTAVDLAGNEIGSIRTESTGNFWVRGAESANGRYNTLEAAYAAATGVRAGTGVGTTQYVVSEAYAICNSAGYATTVILVSEANTAANALALYKQKAVNNLRNELLKYQLIDSQLHNTLDGVYGNVYEQSWSDSEKANGNLIVTNGENLIRNLGTTAAIDIALNDAKDQLAAIAMAASMNSIASYLLLGLPVNEYDVEAVVMANEELTQGAVNLLDVNDIDAAVTAFTAAYYAGATNAALRPLAKAVIDALLAEYAGENVINTNVLLLSLNDLAELYDASEALGGGGTTPTSTADVTLAAGKEYTSLAAALADLGYKYDGSVKSLTVEGKLTVADGETLKVTGDVTVKNGADLSAANGARIEITGTATYEAGATGTMAEGSFFKAYTIVDPSDSVVINGEYELAEL